MAFKPANLVKMQPSTLFTDPATIPAVQPQVVAPQFWLYNSGGDSVATVDTDGYFHYFANTRTVDTLLYNNGQLFNVGDIIWCVCNDDNVWMQVTAITPTITTTIQIADPASVDTAAIQDGAVTNAKLAANAVTNVKVDAAAAIAFSKLAALPSAQLLVGSAGNVPTAVALTGAISITNAGLTALVANSVVTASITNANVTLAKLAAGITPSHVIKFASQVTTVGGAAAEAFAVVGALAVSDRAFVQVVNDGAANVTVLMAVVTNDTLTVTFSGNPGNDVVINYQIIRAAA